MSISRPRISILGAGSVGSFIAYSLKCHPSPPTISLLVRPPHLGPHAPPNDVPDLSANYSISLTHGTSEKPMFSPPHIFPTLHPPFPESYPPFTNIIITTKAHQTMPALRPLIPFINKSTNILFLQNGMGMLEEVEDELRQHLGTSGLPQLLSGIVVQGIRQKATNKKSVVELDTTNSAGYIEIGFDGDAAEHPLLKTLMGAPWINARTIPRQRFRLNQLYKLTSNVVINPLTALYGVKNGCLLESHYQSEISTIIKEVSAVLQRLGDGENELLQESALTAEALRVAKVTAGNSSSMLADVRAGRETEIQYINGWIVRKGKELGIDCPANAELVEKVKALRT